MEKVALRQLQWWPQHQHSVNRVTGPHFRAIIDVSSDAPVMGGTKETNPILIGAKLQVTSVSAKFHRRIIQWGYPTCTRMIAMVCDLGGFSWF